MRRMLICLATLLTIPFGQAFASNLTAGDRAMLQAAMQMHIDAHMVEGRFPYFSESDQAVRRIHPAKAHPMIMKLGEDYILCTDFRDEAGQPVTVDFYTARRADGSFVVFQTEVANRKPLERLMRAGKLSRVQ